MSARLGEEALTLRPKKFGKYLLLDRIGSGGMAEIYRARQFGAAGFQKDLAIKKILPHLAANDSFVRMFIDEAKIAVSLQHANIVQIFDLGAVKQEYFIAMEYVSGKDLLNLLIRCTHLRIRVPQKLALFIIGEVLRGLEAAHEATDSRGNPLNVIHRDVSPSNVLINYDGTVKLGDFGVAKAQRREAEVTRAGTMKGKIGYMSPEQIGGKPVDARSDLFGAATILYEMLAMNRLFKADTELDTMVAVRDAAVEGPIQRLPPSVPEALRAVLRRALRQSPEDRFQSAREFQDALADHVFENKIRVSSADMGRFMRSVFSKEIEEEHARRVEIEALVEQPAVPDAHQTAEMPAVRVLPRPTSATNPGLPWHRESEFRIRRRSGQVTEPIGVTAVMRLLEQDALEHDDQVSIDDGPWRPSSELAAILHGEARAAPIERPPDFAGAYHQADFPRLIYRYAITRATGRMRLSNGELHKEIYWRTGRPEYVTSTERHELLGEYLVARRQLSRRQLHHALSLLADFEGRLGDTLLHLKFISAADLFAALGAHVQRKLVALFAWPEGRYAFFGGEHANTQIVPMEAGALPIINLGVVEEIPLSVILAHFDRHTFTPIRLYRHRLVEPFQLDLTQRQTRIWNAVAHGTSIDRQLGRLLAIPGAREAEVYQVLFLMERLEFIGFA